MTGEWLSCEVAVESGEWWSVVSASYSDLSVSNENPTPVGIVHSC